ncbi:MAG: hypothetical protein AAF432_09390 [Planctomycetota bacterium]
MTTSNPSATTTSGGGNTAAAVNPWTFLPDALRHRREHGDQPGLSLAIAQLYASLGLREDAEDWLQLVPASEQREAAPVRDMIEALPSALIPTEQLIQHAVTNLTAHDELATRLSPHLDAWQQRLTTQRWYRTADDQVVIRRAEVEGHHANPWLRWQDPHAAVNNGSFPVIAQGSENLFVLLLNDLGPIDFLPQLLNGTYTPHASGMTTGICIVQPDPVHMLESLAIGDRRSVLRQSRLRYFIGTGAVDQLRAAFSAERSRWGKVAGIPLSTAAPGNSAPVDQLADEFNLNLQRETDRLSTVVQHRYAARDRAWWQQRFQAIRNGDGPCRVMLMTSRFTMYVQHAVRDIDAALQSIGVDTRLLIEDADTETTNRIGILGTIESFDPDAIMMINWMRDDLPGIPASIPFITWIQDAAPNYSDPNGTVPGAFDFAVGCVENEIVTRRGVNAAQTLRFPVPASAAKFRAESHGHPPLEAHMLIAMNHGETPEQWTERMVFTARNRPNEQRVVELLAPRVIDEARSMTSVPLADRVRNHTVAVIELTGLNPEPAIVDQFMAIVSVPLATRVVRHLMTEWAAEICERRNWTLRLCGRGWEQHPTFARYAGGMLQHGPELRHAYASSAVTLQGSTTLLHQRVYECVLAGGYPAALLKPDDLGHVVEFMQAVALDGAPTHHDVHVDTDTTLKRAAAFVTDFARSPIDHDIPAIDAVRRLLEECVVDTRETDRGSASPVVEHIQPATFINVLDTMRPCLFRSPEELEAVVDRTIEEPDSRLQTIEALDAIVQQWFTYERCGAAILDMVTTRMTDA